MIDIKFRGKLKRSGEWIYGWHWKNQRGNAFIKNKSTLEDFEVIPESVSQYIGLKDKEDREIYGNDIIEFSRRFKLSDKFSNGWCGVVCWHVDLSWRASNIVDGDDYMKITSVYAKDIMIVGNVSENSALQESYRVAKKVLCPKCNKPVHIDDVGMINKDGIWHRDCAIIKEITKDSADTNTQKSVGRNLTSANPDSHRSVGEGNNSADILIKKLKKIPNDKLKMFSIVTSISLFRLDEIKETGKCFEDERIILEANLR